MDPLRSMQEDMGSKCREQVAKIDTDFDTKILMGKKSAFLDFFWIFFNFLSRLGS